LFPPTAISKSSSPPIGKQQGRDRARRQWWGRRCRLPTAPVAYAASRASFTEEEPARRDRLAALKDDIRKSGFPTRREWSRQKR
jgi:hypothetical protein